MNKGLFESTFMMLSQDGRRRVERKRVIDMREVGAGVLSAQQLSTEQWLGLSRNLTVHIGVITQRQHTDTQHST